MQKSVVILIWFQIAEGFPPADVTLMRKALSLDGWLKEEALPEGWRVKRFSKNNITFVTFLSDHFFQVQQE